MNHFASYSGMQIVCVIKFLSFMISYAPITLVLHAYAKHFSHPMTYYTEMQNIPYIDSIELHKIQTRWCRHCNQEKYSTQSSPYSTNTTRRSIIYRNNHKHKFSTSFYGRISTRRCHTNANKQPLQTRFATADININKFLCMRRPKQQTPIMEL